MWELNAGVELDAKKCSEVTAAELIVGTNLDSSRGRRMECSRQRRESGRETWWRRRIRVGRGARRTARTGWSVQTDGREALPIEILIKKNNLQQLL